jgi:hypothetical protein
MIVTRAAIFAKLRRNESPIRSTNERRSLDSNGFVVIGADSDPNRLGLKRLVSLGIGQTSTPPTRRRRVFRSPASHASLARRSVGPRRLSGSRPDPGADTLRVLPGTKPTHRGPRRPAPPRLPCGTSSIGPASATRRSLPRPAACRQARGGSSPAAPGPEVAAKHPRERHWPGFLGLNHAKDR